MDELRATLRTLLIRVLEEACQHIAETHSSSDVYALALQAGEGMVDFALAYATRSGLSASQASSYAAIEQAKKLDPSFDMRFNPTYAEVVATEWSHAEFVGPPSLVDLDRFAEENHETLLQGVPYPDGDDVLHPINDFYATEVVAAFTGLRAAGMFQGAAWEDDPLLGLQFHTHTHPTLVLSVATSLNSDRWIEVIMKGYL